MRKDLYEGKYAPDMQALKRFEDVMEKLQLSAEEEEKDKEEIAMKNMKVEKDGSSRAVPEILAAFRSPLSGGHY